MMAVKMTMTTITTANTMPMASSLWHDLKLKISENISNHLNNGFMLESLCVCGCPMMMMCGYTHEQQDYSNQVECKRMDV